jgi:hypothetical protein
LQESLTHITLALYPLKNISNQNPLLMKASAVDVPVHLPLAKVITRLILLGGFILGGMYGLLALCSFALK